MTAAGAVVAPAEDLADTLEFLRRIWPASGLYVVARLVGKRFEHKVCDTIEEAAAYVKQFDAQGVPTYHGCGVLRKRWVDEVQADGSIMRKVRIQNNIRAAKALWTELDVDAVDSQKFSSREAALDALVDFCQATGVPVPTIISSGTGFHLYWVLAAEVSPEQWQQAADGLKALFTAAGFKASRERTADLASVLRPIGSWHRKDPSNPRPVEYIHEAAPDEYVVLNEIIQVALKMRGIKPPEGVRKIEGAVEGINQDFAVQRDFPPCSLHKIADRCQQVARVRDTRGQVKEPHWYSFIQLACHSVEGDTLTHAWSNGHVDYTAEETDRKIGQIRGQNIGPTLCATFEDRNPGGCDGCPSKGKISSPAQLGAVLPSAPASNTPDDFLTLDDAAALALVMHAPTEDNVSRLFERQYGEKLRYCKVWGSWLSWDGARWRPERTDLAFDFARKMARTANPSGKASTARAAFARGVESFARASRPFATESEQWDRDEFLLNTPGGTIDLRTGEMRPHDQADYITKSTSATPCAGPTPVFDKFMAEITCGDKSLVNYHLQALGAMLSGARADHWLLFWIGSGRNGKNTLGDLIAEIFGDYAKTIPTETLMSTKTQGHPTEIANLRGVRMAVSSEVAEGAYWNETRIKSLTGDTMLTGRLMRGDFFVFTRAHKHLIYGNNRPQLRVVDDAIRARMHIVPFPAMFKDDLGNRDPLMGEKLRAEAPQILARLIEGHRQWVSNGFKLTPCDAVRRETQDYLDTQSTPALWIEEQCEVIENDDRSTNLLPRGGELYTSYSVFKKLRSEQPMSMTRWGEWMGKRFTKVTSNGVRYRGIGLKSPGTEHYGTPSGLSPFSTTIQ